MTTETYAEVHTYGQSAGWATIDYVDSIGSYEWDEFRVLRGPDGLLYVHAAGGCSCNYFGEEDPADFTRVDSWHDVVKAIRAWARESMVDYRASVAEELVSRIAEKRPRKRIAHDPRKGFAQN